MEQMALAARTTSYRNEPLTPSTKPNKTTTAASRKVFVFPTNQQENENAPTTSSAANNINSPTAGQLQQTKASTPVMRTSVSIPKFDYQRMGEEPGFT